MTAPVARRAAAVAAAVLALALAACGGGDEEAASTPRPATTAPSTAGPAAPAPAPLLAEDARASFDALQRRLGGRIGIAVEPLGEGGAQVLGALDAGPAWSTMKVPLVVALMRAEAPAGLTARQAAYARLAIVASDNAAAARLFDDLSARSGGEIAAARAIERVLRDAGDPVTRVATEPDPRGFSSWGQTDWGAGASATLASALARGCLLPEADTGKLLTWMGHVEPDQSFGLGAAGYPTATALALKAGWGPGDDGVYLVREIGVVGTGPRAYSVALLAIPDAAPGASFAAGASMLDEMAAWVREHVGDRATARASRPCAP
ncbi:MAG: serine hydrolase [Thermoleophilia bacterium]